MDFCVTQVKEDDNEHNAKLLIIAPYIYDSRYQAHPYILSTTVLKRLHVAGINVTLLMQG
jgi:hypothetical protein